MRVVDQPLIAVGPALIQCLFQGVENKPDMRAPAGAPADNPPGVSIRQRHKHRLPCQQAVAVAPVPPGATSRFERPADHSAEQERIAYLEKKIQTKDEVLAELMAEHVTLKKEIGDLEGEGI
jgi:hypothetical protein